MATRRPPPGMETLARSDWLLRLGRGACGLPGDTLRRAWAWHPWPAASQSCPCPLLSGPCWVAVGRTGERPLA
ncbi:MAG: hypothetical protein RLZZ117_230 [Cyanobacteriota bacterium]